LRLDAAGAAGPVHGTDLAPCARLPDRNPQFPKAKRRLTMKRTILTLVAVAILAVSALLVVPAFESESTPVVSGIGMADGGS